MRLIDADEIIHIQIYDDEHEEFFVHEMTIVDCLDTYTDEGCPKAVDAVPVVHDRMVGNAFSFNYRTGNVEKMDDVVPVVHGRWIDKDGGLATCSECGDRWGAWSLMNFCPTCGARMEGAEDEN